VPPTDPPRQGLYPPVCDPYGVVGVGGAVPTGVPVAIHVPALRAEGRGRPAKIISLRAICRIAIAYNL